MGFKSSYQECSLYPSQIWLHIQYTITIQLFVRVEKNIHPSDPQGSVQKHHSHPSMAALQKNIQSINTKPCSLSKPPNSKVPISHIDSIRTKEKAQTFTIINQKLATAYTRFNITDAIRHTIERENESIWIISESSIEAQTKQQRRRILQTLVANQREKSHLISQISRLEFQNFSFRNFELETFFSGHHVESD